ncbi:inner membrane protein YeeA [Escherichia coli]|uniref:Inner membrane protein YeeA n=1 Tax=Escherichia coli TaxID=562 RepID=A0A377K461_ECOLX|nr:inner membrane protein YeeA [Escherichia coli]
MNDAVEELRQLLDNHHDLKVVETPIYGYVWLNMETAHQLELLSNLIWPGLAQIIPELQNHLAAASIQQG